MTTAIGRMTTQITIVKPIESGKDRDNFNFEDPADEIIATTFADVTPLRGGELLQADQQQLDVTHSVVIRYQSGLTTDMAVKIEDRRLEISSIINVDERNRWLRLLCIERE